MKNSGVIYYNRGTKCMVRLLVSLYSLRKQWKGPVSVICSGEQEEWFISAIKTFNVEVIKIPYQEGVGSLVLKASLWRYSPYDLTMFLDADTIILKPIDKYFEYIDKYDFVTGNFANWKTDGGIISSRILAWKETVPELIEPAILFGKAVNTGINGWKKNSTLLPEWESLTQKGEKNGCTNRVVDELACQLLLPKHKCYIVGTEWGESVKFGNYDENKTIIIHFHGNKHVGDRETNLLWKKLYWGMRRNINIKELNETWGDKSLKSYLNNLYRDKLTIVTAVNEKYIDKFKSNFPKWMETEGLMEYDYIIFAYKDCHKNIAEFIGPYKNVQLIEWEFPNASNMREEMLSCFVFGTAKHVKTKYWMKLDCDCTPITNKFEIPTEAFQNHITAPKWSYTKMKSDDTGNNDHWLNRLDDWADKIKDFNGTQRMFPKNIKDNRYHHRRICSFCEIEKTAWTQHLANMCGDRLPVPSQDTTTWYAAKRIGRKIMEYNFKNYVKP